MLRDFLISVASGLVVAILAGLIFGRHRDGRRSGPSQSMSMSSNSGGGMGRVLLAFLLGAAIVFVILFFMQGHGRPPYPYRFR